MMNDLAIGELGGPTEIPPRMERQAHLITRSENVH